MSVSYLNATGDLKPPRHRGVPFASTNDPVSWALGLNDVDSVETDWGKILCVCNAIASSLLRNPAASVGSKRMANRRIQKKNLGIGSNGFKPIDIKHLDQTS